MLRLKLCHKRDNSTTKESFFFSIFYSVDVAFSLNMDKNSCIQTTLVVLEIQTKQYLPAAWELHYTARRVQFHEPARWKGIKKAYRKMLKGMEDCCWFVLLEFFNEFGLFAVWSCLVFLLSLDTVAKYTPMSHISVLALMLRILRLRFWPHIPTYVHEKRKKSSRLQLAVAFTTEVRANQKLNTDLARGGSSVFWITWRNWSYMSFHLSYTPDLQSDTQTTTPSKYFSHPMGSRKKLFTELPVLILSIWVWLRNDTAISSKSSSCWRTEGGVNPLSAGDEVKVLYMLLCKTWHSLSASAVQAGTVQTQAAKGERRQCWILLSYWFNSQAQSMGLAHCIDGPRWVQGFTDPRWQGLCLNSLMLSMYRTGKCFCNRSQKHQQAKRRKVKTSNWVLERLEIKGPLELKGLLLGQTSKLSNTRK